MASTIAGTCRIFDACVEDPNVAVRDDQCSLEHIRHLFGKGEGIRGTNFIVVFST